MLTPRRVDDRSTFGMSSGGSTLGFDHALTQNLGGGGGGFGIDTFGTSSRGGGGTAKKFGVSSLADASGRTRTGGFDALPRSPTHGPTAGRGLRTKDTPVAVPVQSLRDSPFMRSAAASSSAAAAAPSAAASSSIIHTRNLASAPFDSDASPIRPLQSSNNNTAFTPATNLTKQLQAEEKSVDETPVASSRLFKETPFSSPDEAWPAGVLSTPSATSTQVVQSGLGYGRHNPCAVTIWGFTQSQAGKILSRFYSFGEVLAREDAQMEGGALSASTQPNWTHLLYRTPVAASMALAQNGRIIDGCMIGVKARTEPSVEGMTTRTKSSFQTPSALDRNGSIFKRSTRKGPSTTNGTFNETSIYATPQSTNDAVRKSICTKLMEYIFNY